ncbi:D-alanyl-D-alanine carboxypeptidase family protein [Agreia sp. PsM10]|uniref:M15 family metallopeptidase n=1 Tax=Agreia sp. PsM10 TaxID=3030533 RepID=UPI00263AE3D3|nr:D-alanyl-D-alanine carboxypeptidase family protein [Agreia sp. PsM10]MDN4642314.1 D-alanyl-D-alanine carboxypeptidase family protein [Agreia sp. PsM10]
MNELRQRRELRRREPSRRSKNRVLIAGFVAIVFVIAGEAGIWAATAQRASVDASVAADAIAAAGDSSAQLTVPTLIPAPVFTAAAATPQEPAPAPASDGFDKSARSIDDPTSIWFVVNKTRPIPDASSYIPPDLVDLRADIPNPYGYPLRQEAADALATMADAATAEIGQQLVAQSGYRAYDIQEIVYNRYVAQLGTAGADLTSARPGYSEHQTGMAVDILATGSGCSLDGPCFGETTAGQWLAANAYRFGYLLSYPADKTAVTGYEYEPWHFRYIGVDLATEMHNEGVTTLEEFFGLPAAPGYLE